MDILIGISRIDKQPIYKTKNKRPKNSIPVFCSKKCNDYLYYKLKK